MKEFEKFKGLGDYSFSVCKSQVQIVGATGTRNGEDEIAFCVLSDGKELNIDKQPLTVSLSKDEAKRLAIQLLKLSVDDVPLTGVSINNHQNLALTIHQGKESDGSLSNEPIILISDIEENDVTKDGCICTSVANESAREMIEILAKIV